MKERPILFSGEMVKALLANRKTQTRRVLKPQPISSQLWGYGVPNSLPTHFCVHARWAEPYPAALKQFDAGDPWLPCPYGKRGDRLWVREAWSPLGCDEDGCFAMAYKASGEQSEVGWRNARYMPRWASRLLLEITEIRCERVQAIGDEDAIAESCTPDGVVSPRDEFSLIWDSINGKKEGATWADNPFVWGISFRRVHEQNRQTE